MLVSVIIPYFKDEANIENAIESALNQTHKKIEIIIIDDENSTDSKKTINKLKKKFKFIKVISTLKNLGVSIARNKGIRSAKGNFIAFLDSDDLWKKKKIEEQLKMIKKNKADVCYTNYMVIDKNDNFLYKIKSPKKLFYNDLLSQCPIACSSIILKKSLLKNIKFKNLSTKEDYLLWLQLSKKGYKFIGVNQFLSIYRVRSNSLSSKHINKIYSAFMIYYYYLNYNFIVAFSFVIRLYFNAFKKKYL